jgi:hypothetical protein
MNYAPAWQLTDDVADFLARAALVPSLLPQHPTVCADSLQPGHSNPIRLTNSSRDKLYEPRKNARLQDPGPVGGRWWHSEEDQRGQTDPRSTAAK